MPTATPPARRPASMSSGSRRPARRWPALGQGRSGSMKPLSPSTCMLAPMWPAPTPKLISRAGPIMRYHASTSVGADLELEHAGHAVTRRVPVTRVAMRVAVEVDEPGTDDRPRASMVSRPCSGSGADSDDPVAADADVPHGIQAGLGIDDPAAGDDEIKGWRRTAVAASDGHEADDAKSAKGRVRCHNLGLDENSRPRVREVVLSERRGQSAERAGLRRWEPLELAVVGPDGVGLRYGPAYRWCGRGRGGPLAIRLMGGWLLVPRRWPPSSARVSSACCRAAAGVEHSDQSARLQRVSPPVSLPPRADAAAHPRHRRMVAVATGGGLLGGARGREARSD